MKMRILCLMGLMNMVNMQAVGMGVIAEPVKKMHFKKINQKNIVQKRKKIASNIQQEALLKKQMFLGTIGLVGGLICYSLYKSDHADNVKTPMTQDQADVLMATNQKTFELIEKQGHIKIGEKKGLLSKVWGWGKYTLHSAFNMAALNFFAGFMLRSVGPIQKYFGFVDQKMDDLLMFLFNKRNIQWFSLVHAPLKGMFEDLEQSALLLEQGSLVTKKAAVFSSQDIDVRLASLHASWGMLVSKIENLLGFMDYSINRIAKKVTKNNTVEIVESLHALQLIKETIQQTVDVCAHRLNNICSREQDLNNELQGLHQEIVRCHLMVDAEKQRFSLFEAKCV